MNGTINNIKISGTVVTRSEVAGGIVGENEGIINNSHSEVHIRSISQSNVIGGFVGNNIGEIYNSTSISIVDGSYWAGGFSGGNRGLIKNSYSESDIKSQGDRKSTRLNSSHVAISYAVFCLKKK